MAEAPLSQSQRGTREWNERGRRPGNVKLLDNATGLRYVAASGKAQSIR